MGFIDSFYDVMEVEAGFLKYCMELLAREYSEDLKRLEVELPRVDRIPCVRFDEAKRLAAEPREAAEPKSAAGPDLSIYLREAEKTLATRFGRKVHIINGRKKGKIELEYYNPEDLNTLLELLEQLPSAGKGGGSL